MKKHWYRQTLFICVVCGLIVRDRERVYGKKPADIRERYIVKEIYDKCEEGSHEMV